MATNIFDNFNVAITESYVYKFFDVLDDCWDNDLCFIYNLLDFPKNTNMIIDFDTNIITHQPKRTNNINIISKDHICICHDFLKTPVFALHLTLNNNIDIRDAVFDNFYAYMYNPILSSVQFDLDFTKTYFSEIPLQYLEMYNINTESINYITNADTFV